ncbi:hypothetical protein SAMN05660642_02453 [Geodermatophilus siccatus]|uniref:DUF4268 domain-containing protein n=1 Tax=Geodermatophilus siccatus TaxID=1137991 RepID=A0A1G9T311_9ACTN|nr:hypothetical protein SAMN05660642_02453 [Geodermatophilus siccatus]
MWPGEATHFTPWLAANLDWLDALGLGRLELVGTEVVLPTVNRNLDILARTPDGRRIAIENQYLKVDHDHLTRGLAYAVGHDAKALVVIAEDHGSEFIAIADYLNSAYEQLGSEKGIAVFLVQVTAEQVGQAIVPRFTVVARPNTWLTAVHGQDDGGPRSVTALLAACDSSFRSAAQEILEQWESRPGASMRINAGSVSVSLDYPYIPGEGPRSVYVLYGTGVMTVNRGYFKDFGSLGEDRVAELDRALETHFPALNDRPYYPSVVAPEPGPTAAFADWLIEWIPGGSPHNRVGLNPASLSTS